MLLLSCVLVFVAEKKSNNNNKKKNCAYMAPCTISPPKTTMEIILGLLLGHSIFYLGYYFTVSLTCWGPSLTVSNELH